MLEVRRIEPRAGISHGDKYAIRFGWGDRDEQVSSPIRTCRHGLDGIYNQVKQYLLQLHTIALDQGQILRQVRLHCNLLVQCFAIGQPDHLADRLANVEALVAGRRFLDERTDAADDIGGTIGISDYSLQ